MKTFKQFVNESTDRVKITSDDFAKYDAQSIKVEIIPSGSKATVTGDSGSAMIWIGTGDGKIRAKIGNLAAEQYMTLSNAIEDVLKYTDSKFGDAKWEEAKAVAAEGEDDEEDEDN